MSEIKFACPHCRQHIACDGDYADMCIVCPACGKPMMVPLLTTADATRQDLCLVASIPTPNRKLHSHIPMLDPWTEDAWEEHVSEVTGKPLDRTPLWIVSALATIILAAVLRANGIGWTTIIITVVLGSLFSGYLMRTGEVGGNSIAYAVGRGLLACLAVMIAIPVIALGVLFVGCSCQ